MATKIERCECQLYNAPERGYRWVRFTDRHHPTGILMSEEYQPHYYTRADARADARTARNAKESA